MPKFVKPVLFPDTYQSPDGEIKITPARIKHWVESFRRMKAAGVVAPVPYGHHSSASPDEQEFLRSKYNAGFVDDMLQTPDGGLVAVLDVPRAEDASRIGTSLKEVSPQIEREFVDGKGRKWNDVITHLALVTMPVVPGQPNFESADDAPLPKAAMRLSLTTRLAMADKDYEEPDETTDEDDTDDVPDEDTPPPPVDEVPPAPPPEPTPAAMDPFFLQAKNMLAECFGITLPDHTTPEKGWEHLTVALSAIKGNKDKEGDGDKPKDDPLLDEQNKPPATEEQPMMSLGLKTANARIAKLEADLADRTFEAVSKDIDDLVANGKLTAATGKTFKESLGKKRLSLANGSDRDADKITAQIEMAKSLPEGTFWTPEERTANKVRMRSTGQPPPKFGTETTKEEAKAVADQQLKLAGVRV